MSATYTLVNFIKKEYILFAHTDASKARELTGNQASSTLTTRYQLENTGDQILFVPYSYVEWPFSFGIRDFRSKYAEVTDRVVAELIANGILVSLDVSPVYP